MCDDRSGDEMKEYLRRKELTRRDFGALSAAAGLSIILPRAAHAVDVMEMDVNVETPDGAADCYFVHPVTGAAAGVLIWPDALGLRPAFRQMGRRLAEEGYSVLVVNPFYRMAKSPVVQPGATFADEATRNIVMPLMRSLTPQTHATDASAFVSWLDAQSVVDKSRKIGTMGYCMGGPITMRTAAAIPDRIGAGASFHGGGLVTDTPDSPHLLVPRMRAQYLFAIAANDDAEDPNAKDVLRESYAEAGLAAEIEVYTDTLHGWCPPDSAVYHEAQAERAWSRLLALFETALA
jgi:carboxymethylenebutenolidase